MKTKITTLACALLMTACGGQEKPQSAPAPINVDESQLASEYENLPQGMILRVPVDANGNMDVNSAELRNHLGSAIGENDIANLQSAFASAQLNPVYANSIYNPSLMNNINYINLGEAGKGKGAYQAPGQFPGQVPGKGLPNVYDKSGKGLPGQYPGQVPGKGPGQFPGQYPGQVPGKVGQFPGQYPGQVPGKGPGQFPGQYPGQVPGKVGQFPGQLPGQFPGQFPGQVPGKSKLGFALNENWESGFYPTTVGEIDQRYYRYDRNDMRDNFFHSRFRPVYRSGIYSNLYWSYYMNPYFYYAGSSCYFYYPRPTCGGYNWCGGY